MLARIKVMIGLLCGCLVFGFAIQVMAQKVTPHKGVAGRVTSIDCNDRQATIETEDCKEMQVGFASQEECRKHRFGDVIHVSGERRGSEIAAEQVKNMGLPNSISGRISSISCADRSMEVETCNRKCTVAVDEEKCRGFQYGDKVHIQGSETNRNTGCVGLAESISKQSKKKRK